MAELYGTELVVHRRPARRDEVRILIGDPHRAVERLRLAAQTVLSDCLAMMLSSEVEAQVVA